MIINAEFLDSLDTTVHQSQSMLLAASEAEFGQARIVDAVACGAVARTISTCKIHFSIDQVVVRWWSNGVFICEVSPHHTFKYGEVVIVIVVVEHHWAKIDVVRDIGWAMYYLLTC